MKFVDAKSRGGVGRRSTVDICTIHKIVAQRMLASTSGIDSYNDGVRIGRKYVSMRELTESAHVRSMRPSCTMVEQTKIRSKKETKQESNAKHKSNAKQETKSKTKH
jgi:hypothetical protein